MDASAQTTTRALPDTLPTFPILVQGEHVTLREIIQRSLEGERSKLAGHHDITYTMTARNITRWKKKMTIEDTIMRAYTDADGTSRTVVLDEMRQKYARKDDDWVPDDDDDEEDSHVQVSADGIADFEHIPFFLEDEADYDFELLDRTIETDRVIFKIGFKPKSDFKPLPSGTVYIDTNHYRIIHEEFQFDKNPYPLFLKGVRRVSRHWAVLPGGEWVFTKIMAEIDLRSIPFGMAPEKISVALIRDDFVFDRGYDARLFGELKGETTATATPLQAEAPEPPRGLLASLQDEDASFFTDRLIELDDSRRERVIAEHDSLGLERFQDYRNRGFPISFDPGLAENLLDYNRVEGLVIGARGTIDSKRRFDGPELTVEGAYATTSEEFRHFERLSVPITRGRLHTRVFANYADRVQAYGSNQLTGNAVLALVAGQDEQDYLRREGGAAGFAIEHTRGLRFVTTYEAGRIQSVPTSAQFAVFGDIWKPNDPVDEGDERAAHIRLGWEPDDARRFGVVVGQHLAGGGLGGDFNYARTDASFDWRHYLIGRHEVYLHAAGVTTRGRPPVQALADVGGLATVRGYPRRHLLGQSSVAMRLEYLVPYDLIGSLNIPVVSWFGLQLVPWADAARVWDGTSQEWIHAAGFGLQTFLGAFEKASNLRVDFAFPTATDAPDNFKVNLSFTAGLF